MELKYFLQSTNLTLTTMQSNDVRMTTLRDPVLFIIFPHSKLLFSMEYFYSNLMIGECLPWYDVRITFLHTTSSQAEPITTTNHHNHQTKHRQDATLTSFHSAILQSF